MLAHELLELASLLLAGDGQRLAVAQRLTQLAESLLSQEEGQTIGFLTFHIKEISCTMTLKKSFIANGCRAHVLKRPCGKNTYLYEIRYRRDGYKVCVSSTDLPTARKKFIEAMKNATPVKNRLTFGVIALEYFSVREGRVATQTLKAYRSLYDRFLSGLENKEIRSIRTAEINKIFQRCGTTRTYEDLRSVTNQIFSYAERNGIIHYNPVKATDFIRSERQHGVPLTRTEIAYLVDVLNENGAYSAHKDALLLMLFCGLRPNECRDVRMENGFIIARNSKRKGGKVEYKRIPMPFPLQMPVDVNTARTNEAFKSILPGHKQYDLRHTFASVCAEFVRSEVVAVWLGDSQEKLVDNTYIHYTDDFMLEQMKKVKWA